MMWRIVRWPVYAIAFLIIVSIAALAFLQTGTGKRLLAEQLSSRLSTENAGFEVSGLDGLIPLDMHVGTLRLSDRNGIWLKADGVTLDWSPSALLNRRIQVDEIIAERIELMRPPVGDGTPRPDTEEPFRLPELPTSLPPITVERLSVPDIMLGASVFGEAANFALNGSIRANDSGDTVAAELDLRRKDKETASATLNATAGLNPPGLDLALNARESGGLIASIVNRPAMQDVTLSLEGKGPLDSWSGNLNADASGLARVDADLGLALVDQPRLTIDGKLQPASGSLPEGIAALIGEQLSIDLDLVQTRAQALAIRKAAVSTLIASLDAEGSIDFDDGKLELKSQLDTPDLAPLSPLAKAALAGKANVELNVTGTLEAPAGTLDLRVDQPSFDGNAADGMATIIEWASIAPLSSEQPAFDIVIDGGIDGLSIPDTVLPDPNLSWNAKLAVPLSGEIAIEQLAVETAESSLSAVGNVDPGTLDGTIDLALDAPSLKRLIEPYGQPFDGKALVNAAVRLADQARTITVDLDADLDNLSGIPPGAAELLGEQTNLQAKLTLDPSQTLNIEALAIDGAHVGLNGQADVGLNQQTIAGQLNVVLPDLTVLGSLIPEDTEGAIGLDADLGGTFQTPSVDLRINGQDLVLAGEPITVLDIALAGNDLIASPNGDLQINLTARETPAELTLGYLLARETLNLDDIKLTGPETGIGGKLDVDLETNLIDGALEGQISALSALKSWLQQEIDGRVDLSADLAPDGERQNVDLALEGRDIQGDFGSVKTVNADASVTNATSQPQISGKASLTGFEQGATKVDGLTLTASGNDGAVDLEFGAAGEVIKPFELAGKGAARFEDGFTLGIEELDGSFAGEPLRLQDPFAFQQAGDDTWLSGLDLRLGDASLKGNVEIGEASVLGDITLDSLPLRWVEAFGGPALTGDARADVDLSGSASSPTVTATVDIEGVLGEGLTPDDLPLDLSINAVMNSGRLTADLEASRVTRKPITAAVSLPANLTLRPFVFDMPEDGALDGEIKAEVLLPRLADFLALDDQELKGTLLADIAIGGTLGDPKVQGPVTLKGGGYENGETGTRFRNLSLAATLSSDRIDVTEFIGKTGKKRGTLESSGWLEFNADKGFPLSVSLGLDEARLVNRDDADARISGNVAMTGTLDQAEVKGRLTVDRAEIALPDNGGPSLPDLDVTEVGGRIVNPPEEEKVEKEKPFDPNLDLRIKLPKKIYVRGRGLDSEWKGDLHITGSASNPSIVGSLEVKEGHFDFLDKRFKLDLGEITFSGATPPNPIVALRATAEDGDFKAIIKLNGPADDPQLLLESEPALPQDEVLARLLFNRELSEIGPVEAGKLAIAANKLRSGGGGFDVFGEIRGALKIDTLDVVSDEEGESRVKAGKYLDDDIYVEVEKGAGDETGRARIEIELLPNIAVEAETSENADSGVGIKWKYDY